VRTEEDYPMQKITENGGKSQYTTPRLTVYGTLEELTKSCDKTYGSADGFTFQGQTVICSVS
jgi:hypothetical protein